MLPPSGAVGMVLSTVYPPAAGRHRALPHFVTKAYGGRADLCLAPPLQRHSPASSCGCLFHLPHGRTVCRFAGGSRCCAVPARAGERLLLKPFHDFGTAVADWRLRRVAQLLEAGAFPFVPPDFERVVLESEQRGGFGARQQVVRIGHDDSSPRKRSAGVRYCWSPRPHPPWDCYFSLLPPNRSWHRVTREGAGGQNFTCLGVGGQSSNAQGRKDHVARRVSPRICNITP